MRHILASDLDGTLIPAADSAGHQHIRRFAEVVSVAQLRLAYVTGRHLALALDGLLQHDLPLPETLACDVGTSVHWHRDGEWIRDEEYDALVGSSPGAAPAHDIRGALLGIGGLALQEEVKQAPFKVSYYVDGPSELLSTVADRLSSVGDTRLVHSLDPYDGRGLLDVLPERVGKRTAVEYVVQSLGLTSDEAIYAGDSGNDRDAILSGSRAIVVGNADPRLKDDLRVDAANRGITGRIYFAERAFAEGVLEGLQYFDVVAVDASA